MSGDVWAYAGLLALMLVLPLSALRGTRLDGGTALKMAGLWAVIFAVAAVFFSHALG